MATAMKSVMGQQLTWCSGQRGCLRYGECDIMSVQIASCGEGVSLPQRDTERIGLSMHPQYSPFQRLFSKVDSSRGPASCWPWVGGRDGHRGYSTIDVAGKNVRVHRITYELVNGPISIGLEIDHLCRNPFCVNPAHLEAVTHRVNCLRGVAPSAQCARQTHCKNGHPFDLLNTYIDKRGWRICRICRREYQRRVAAMPR
jgi:hypothetical protein